MSDMSLGSDPVYWGQHQYSVTVVEFGCFISSVHCYGNRLWNTVHLCSCSYIINKTHDLCYDRVVCIFARPYSFAYLPPPPSFGFIESGSRWN